MAFQVVDALRRGFGCGNGGHVRDPCLDGRLADIAVIVDALISGRGVDDHVKLAVGDHIQDIGASFIDLQHALSLNAFLLKGLVGIAGRVDLEAVLPEASGQFYDLRLVLLVDRDQDGTLQRQPGAGRFLRLVEGFTCRRGQAQDFTGGSHLRSQDRVDLLEHVEGEDRFLDTVIRDMLLFQLRNRGFPAGQLRGDDIRGDRDHADVADLGYQRNGTGRSGIGFQHVDSIVLNGVLHVHQADDMHLFRDLSGVLLDGLQMLFGNMSGRNDAGRVTGMDTRQLNMLHNSRYESVGSVADGVCLAFHGVIQETVDQDGTVGGYADSRVHIVDHMGIVINDFHAAAAQDIGRTDHDRIADLFGDADGFLYCGSHA